MQGHGKPRMPATETFAEIASKASRALWRLRGLNGYFVSRFVPYPLPRLLCPTPTRNGAVDLGIGLSGTCKVFAAKGARDNGNFLPAPKVVTGSFRSLHHKAPLSHLGGMVVKILTPLEPPPFAGMPSRPARRPAEFQRTSGQLMGRGVLPTVETRHTRTWPGYRLGLLCLGAASSPLPP